MNMGMIDQLAGPGVQHAQKAERAAKISWLLGDVLQGPGAFLKEQVVSKPLVLTEESAQGLRNCKSYEEITNGEQALALPLAPGLRPTMAALAASPMTARMVREVLVAAPVAHIEAAATGGRMTAQNRLQRPVMRTWHPGAILLQVRRAVPADHIG
jgi:hypothetical protein